MGLGNIIDKMILLAAINRLHSATCLCLLEARIWISNVIPENIKTEDYIYTISLLLQNTGGRHGRDHMVVGSTTIHAISAYQH